MARTYGQWCPVTRALDLIGDRWTLVIVRDLLAGPRRFGMLRAELPGISPTLLSERLRTLVKAGVVEHVDSAYRLTEFGRDLRPVVDAFGRFGVALLDRPRPDDVFLAHFPAMGLRFLFRSEALPDEALRVVVEFETGPLDVAVAPGRPSDGLDRLTIVEGRSPDATATVASTLGALTRYRQGRLTRLVLERRGLARFEGDPDAVEALLHAISPPPPPGVRPRSAGTAGRLNGAG